MSDADQLAVTRRSLATVAGSAARAFGERVGQEPVGSWAAPGRVNVIGEHTDYNDGFVLPMAIDRYVVVSAAPRLDGQLRLHSLQLDAGAPPVTVSLAALAAREPAAISGWAAYPAAMAWVLQQAGHRLGGADLVIDSSVPVGAGLSSSAALECAVGQALAALHDLSLTPIELARLAQRAENQFVHVPCGIMDQLAATCGRAGHVLFIDTRSLAVRPSPFDLAAAGLTLVIADTHTRHQLANSAYADRRAACERAAAALGVAALRDVTLAEVEAGVASLPEPLCRRARHIVTENSRVLRVVELLAANRLTEIGPLLTASHVSLRDDFEVSCAELDVGVAAALAAGALGARMTGGGFGGSLIALVAERQCGAVEQAIVDAFAGAGFARPSFSRATAADGARRLEPGEWS
jgi:galactokinase